MTLNKQKMVREIGRRTRLTNREVLLMLETLIDVWTEELVNDGRIELQNFIVLETQTIDRGPTPGRLNKSISPRYIQRLTVRSSKRLKQMLKKSIDEVYEL